MQIQIFSTDPVIEKYEFFEKPLKSRKTGLFKKSKTLKSDGSDGFYGRGKITDPVDPVGEDTAFLGGVTACVALKNQCGIFNQPRSKKKA